jgi:hypothetical protein
MLYGVSTEFGHATPLSARAAPVAPTEAVAQTTAAAQADLTHQLRCG